MASHVVGITSAVAGFVGYILWQLSAWKRIKTPRKSSKDNKPG